MARDFSNVQETLNSYLQQGSHAELYKFDGVLLDAIQWKNSEIIFYLLFIGVSLEKVHCYKATKVKLTAGYEVFLQNEWDINQPLDIYEPSALELDFWSVLFMTELTAARFIVEDWKLINWFLNHNADSNVDCYFDYILMFCVIKNVSMKIIRLLFECGSDIRKEQLIHHAVEQRSHDVIEMLNLLLQKDAQLNEQKYENHWSSWNMMFFTGLSTYLHRAVRAQKL